ncbi:MAG TPA: glycoside hydrolase family 13 protein [Lacipirellulaceae bacterium]|nr:glycoside hydrolase family 13 protein [Lacipirellulaceae bacterium]
MFRTSRAACRPPWCSVARQALSLALLLLLTIAAGCSQRTVDANQAVATSAQRDASATQRDRQTSHVDTEIRPVAHSVAGKDVPQLAATVAEPSWVQDAVFYQIFPERYCNGDKSNDPTRESLESPDNVPKDWKISPWTGDWYARADWEKERGPNFFENGVFDRRYGGDLQGVLNKLDYLSNLGINTIYFNPVFYAKSLHKYDGASFHHIDPYFGPDPSGDLKMIAAETADPASWQWTAADKLFLEVLKQAHARGIRIIIDGVFNHTGRDFFAFADLRKRQADSPYKDWYIVQSFDDPATPQNEFRYKGWWGTDSLPEFADNAQGNDMYEGPKKYIFDCTRRWMDPNGDGDPSDGIDGWRLDVANEVPTGFWRDWHALVRKINPQAYTVAEIWDDARRFLEDGGFSATMNYHGFAIPTKGFLIDQTLAPSGAERQFNDRRNEYPPAMQYALQNLMDSHDTDRSASMIVNAGLRPYSQPARFDYDINVSPRNVPTYDVRKPNDEERRVQRLVVLLQMTYIGPPMVYYGDEAGMWGADDPCDRMPMVWPELTYEPQQADPLGRKRDPDEVKFDDNLFNYYRAAIAMRRESSALRQGGIEFVTADDPAEFLGFLRNDAHETLFVGLNRGHAPFRWKVPTAAGSSVAQIFTASGNVDQVTIESTDGQPTVTIPAVDGVVLRVQSSK